MNRSIRFLIGCGILLFATVVAWYEGSAIIENSLAWRSSTPFTQFLGREIYTGKEIAVLDYFVYALKFQPFYPMLMVVSSFYLIASVIVMLKKLHYTKTANGLVAFVGIMSLCATVVLFDAVTMGAKILGGFSFVCVLVCIVYFIFRKKNQAVSF